MIKLIYIDSRVQIERWRIFFVVLLMSSSIFVFSCKSKSHSVIPNERKFLTDYFGGTEELKFVFKYPMITVEHWMTCLAVTRDGTCYNLIGLPIEDYINKRDTDKKYFLYLSPFGFNKCGKMINDSTIEFRTDKFGSIDVTVDFNQELKEKSIEIDFTVFKNHQGNIYNLFNSSWATIQRDTSYTKNSYVAMSGFKQYRYNSGHVSIPDSLEDIEAIRLHTYGSGYFDILLDTPGISSSPSVIDKRKDKTQRVNEIKVVFRATNPRKNTLIGRIENDGLVILNKDGEPTKLIMTEIYPTYYRNKTSVNPEIRFGKPTEYERHSLKAFDIR